MFSRFFLSFLFFTIPVAHSEVVTTSRTYSLVLGVSRVVFHEDMDSYEVTVSNKQDYPILVSSKINNSENNRIDSSYVVSPALFRLEANQKNTITIVKSSDVFPKDVESLNWLCVKSIPPTEGSAWVGNSTVRNRTSLNVNVLIDSCIKIFSRPASIKNISDASYGSQLIWSRKDGRLTGYNPTPYIMNFNSIKISGKSLVPPVSLNPYSSFNVDVPIKKGSHVKWSLINDYGGESDLFEANIK
ncbi:fimbrial biogenesis chaperone [Escherichia coli]|uniref:fimbrial biogenesis chaperone n=1 Tax=Escherichia coli TaxID=562 RepID=UPI0009456C2A|nr:fimbria/pilus periplasmic chaperone [Escherichia coli]EEC7775281.1 fimbria/pilus periplasmic chaperone [Escherichia coli]EEX0399320.1 fimbria/pilus periplasmic chaperone [Escherichia coli]EFG5095717.1 fimbria/pilus periplasmic chaperone [Escherichia coli]EFH1304299.1 fimbria/pilus periplasmic chaperone [Escherichia coli]EGM9513357.1 fimbria/pilus periplasmic chaperone [Escherichia coli]